jgi:hypothetical protein
MESANDQGHGVGLTLNSKCFPFQGPSIEVIALGGDARDFLGHHGIERQPPADGGELAGGAALGGMGRLMQKGLAADPEIKAHRRDPQAPSARFKQTVVTGPRRWLQQNPEAMAFQSYPQRLQLLWQGWGRVGKGCARGGQSQACQQQRGLPYATLPVD